MTLRLVSFANSEHARSLARLRLQATRIGLFTSFSGLVETDLDEEFRSLAQDNLQSGTRGFGFWAWKPQVIIQEMLRANDGDIVLYLDAGSHLNAKGLSRMKEYLEICKESQSGILAFQLSEPEEKYTKEDVFFHFGVPPNSSIRQTGQVQAGAILACVNPTTLRFFYQWRDSFIHNFSLINDSESRLPNSPAFKATRHDQSIFSVMAKLNHVALVSADENSPIGESLTWRSLRKLPIHHKRDFGSRSAYFRREIKILKRAADISINRLAQKGIRRLSGEQG